MSDKRNDTRLQFFSENIEENAPLSFEDITATATFDGSQANVTTEKIELQGNEAEAIKNEVSKGNIYEKKDYKIQATNGNQSYAVFDGYKDLTTFTENLLKDTVSVAIVPKDDLRTFTEKLEAVTFGLLLENGTFKSSDYLKLDYIVEKVNNVTERMILSVNAFSVLNQSVVFAKGLVADVGNTTAHATDVPPNPAGGAVSGIVTAAANVIYAVGLGIQLKTIYGQLRDAFYPPKRQHNITSFRKLMSNVCGYLNYEFVSSISELDNYYYLPSNLGVDSFGSNGFLSVARGTPNGLPNVSDGELFNCGGFFKVMVKVFHARFKIEGNKVYFERENADFWKRKSKFVFKGGIIPTKQYNTDELNRALLIAFGYDSADIYTVENAKGTSVTISTKSTNFTNKKALVEKGFKRIDLPFSLGNIKTKLTSFETILDKLMGAINGVAKLFGESTSDSVAARRLGVLKVSTNNTRAKILYIENGKIPTNHREKLSALQLWNNGINKLSFVQNNYGNQYAIYKGIKQMVVGLDGFIELVKNKFATNEKGDEIEIDSAKWKIASDKLENLDYRVKEIYTKNLEEIITEVE